MKHKVQKIREEVVRMHNLLPIMDGDNISVNYADRICTTLEMYIDSLQEESIHRTQADIEAAMAEVEEKSKAFTEAHKGETAEEILAQMRGENPVNEGKMTIRKEWFEHCKKSWYNEGYIDGQHNRDRQLQEPVSEELEEAAYHNCIDRLSKESIEDFKAGANWQKEQMMAKAVDGLVTFECYGNDNKVYGYIAHDPICLDDVGFKDTDKVKMILIKEYRL